MLHMFNNLQLIYTRIFIPWYRIKYDNFGLEKERKRKTLLSSSFHTEIKIELTILSYYSLKFHNTSQELLSCTKQLVRRATFRVCAIKKYSQWMSITQKTLSVFLLNFSIIFKKYFVNIFVNFLKFGWNFLH